MGTYLAAGRTFNLSPRALAFAKIRAEQPRLSVKACAVAAGYANAGAAVRGFELLKDDRVISAILHYSAIALARASADLSARMEKSCIDDRRWRVFDRPAIDRLRAEGKALAERMAKIEKLYETTPRIEGRRVSPKRKAAGRGPAGLARAKRVIHKDNRESMLREIRGSLDLLKALGVNLEDQRQSVPD